MKTRMIHIPRILAGLTIAVTVLYLAGCATRTQPRLPNIIVIIADDLGYADLGVQGSTEISTPNIDSLAMGGIRFTNGYVTGPVCSPTRAELLTGRYPQRFGHEFNLEPSREHSKFGLPLSQTTIADHLRDAGYRTALFGKWHLGTGDAFQPMARGFNEFFGFLDGQHSYVDAQATGRNPLLDGKRVVKEMTYLTDEFTARAVDFIERQQSRPFFLYLPFNAVHGPLEATDKYLARVSHIPNIERRTYAAMLSAMDDGIGRVMAVLRAEGLEEHTLIFFFNDNGGVGRGFGDSLLASNAPLRGSKGGTWEGGIRVPFIIRWRGHLPEGKIDGRPIIQLDVLPTALAAAGVPIQVQWNLDGVNLLPYLTGRLSGPPHETLYWRYGEKKPFAKVIGSW